MGIAIFTKTLSPYNRILRDSRNIIRGPVDENDAIYKKKKKKKDSETNFSSDSDCDEFANEIQFVGDILQPFQFELVFTAAELQAKKDIACTSVIVFDRLLRHTS